MYEGAQVGPKISPQISPTLGCNSVGTLLVFAVLKCKARPEMVWRETGEGVTEEGR